MRFKKTLIICLALVLLSVTNGALAENCQNLRAQVDVNACTYANLDLATKKLNNTYKNYSKKLDAEQKKQFKEIQLAWIKFKDLSCKFEASGVEGGSAYPMILDVCLTEKTKQRYKELEILNNCQEGDLNCPAR